MKNKIFYMFLASVLALSLCSCSESDEPSSSEEISVTEETSTTEKIPATTEEKTVPVTTEKKEPTVAPTTQPEIAYLSGQDVQFDSENSSYNVMFAFLDSTKENYVDGSGTAMITIYNEQDEVVYDGELGFTEDDFTTWKSDIGYDTVYGCQLNISSGEITPGLSEYGTMSIELYGDNFYFESFTLNIDELPLKQGDISLPQTPATYTDDSYSSVSTLTVHSITCETDIGISGDMNATFSFEISLDSKTDDVNIGETCHIGWQLTDNEGYVVDSGTVITPSLWVGDKAKCEEYSFDLDPNKSYTLTLSNST